MIRWLACGAWLSAFVVGRHTGHLYEFLATTAVLLAGLLLWHEPHLRTRLRFSALDVIIGVVVGAVSLAGTYVVFPYVVKIVPWLEGEVRDLYALAHPSSVTLAAIVAVSVCEEVIFRGSLLESVRERFGWRSVVVAAVPYALAQVGGGSIALVGLALVFGVLWGAIAWWRGSIIAPVLAHLMWTPIVLGVKPLVDLSSP